MAYTDINSEDRLVQATFAEHLERELGWDSVYAFNQESFGPTGTLGRSSRRAKGHRCILGALPRPRGARGKQAPSG